MTVADIGPADVLRCIEPIWNTKRETASRVRQRIERILDYAATRQYRSGDNPAAHVTESLPKGGNGKESSRSPAPMPSCPPSWRSCATAIQSAHARLSSPSLTAARTGEIIGAAWDEFDLKTRTWTIPAERMKAGQEHKVPLCDRAVEILRELPRHGDKVFPLSNMAMLELLRGMRPGHTVHGFRSTFMDWAHERTATAKVVIDMALAHTVGDKVEAAYRRGDLFEKRRKLMEAWDHYCSKPVPVSDKVIALAARG